MLSVKGWLKAKNQKNTTIQFIMEYDHSKKAYHARRLRDDICFHVGECIEEGFDNAPYQLYITRFFDDKIHIEVSEIDKSQGFDRIIYSMVKEINSINLC
jgi:hypothetical protein